MTASHGHGAGSHQRFGLVSGLLSLGVTALLVVMLARVAQLQLLPGKALQAHIEPRVTRRAELGLRGDLRDRRGRLLSATRFGYRVLIDPTLLPEDPSRDIGRLAEAIDTPADQVGERIVGALVENSRRDAMRRTESAAAAGMKPGVLPVLLQIVSQRDGTEAESAVIDEPAPARPKGPIRYMVCSTVLTDEQARAVKELDIPGVTLERQQVREYPGGAEVASLVGKVGFGHVGLMGVEKLLDEQLAGTKGSMNFVRDAKGRPLWVEPGFIQPAAPGSDVTLSVDLEIQRLAYDELSKGVLAADAAGGRILVVDSWTGEILAMADVLRQPADAVPFPWEDAPVVKKGKRPPPAATVFDGRKRYLVIKDDPARTTHPALGRNRCVEDVYEPGSTFKPFVWSVITELRLARPEEVFDTEGGNWRTSYGRPVKDVHRAPTMTWSEVLVHSSNIGMVKGAERMSFLQLHDAVRRYGFGKPVGLGLPGEATGLVTEMKNWSKYTQTSVAFGNEVAVTPLQMARAFCAFARSGPAAGTLPRLRLTAAAAEEAEGVTYRVLPANVANLTRDTLRFVADNMESKYAKPAEGERWRYTIFGKSGTAKIPVGNAPKGKRKPRGTPGYFEQYNSSFIAAGPIEDPRLVVLVVIDDPGPERINRKQHYGAAVAGPVVRRVMERSLTYLGVPPSPGSAEAARQQAGTGARAQQTRSTLRR